MSKCQNSSKFQSYNHRNGDKIDNPKHTNTRPFTSLAWYRYINMCQIRFINSVVFVIPRSLYFLTSAGCGRLVVRFIPIYPFNIYNK